MGTEIVRRAMAGDKIKYGFAKKTFEVLRPCGENWSGSWVCVTHNTPFENQLQKDIHIHAGSHTLVWWCSGHGPEQP